MTDDKPDLGGNTGNEKERAEEDTLLVLTEPEATPMGLRDFTTPVRISVNEINKNMKVFASKFSEVLQDVRSIGRYELSEVTINVGINAGGEIQLIGVARGHTQVVGGVTLKFVRPSAEGGVGR